MDIMSRFDLAFFNLREKSLRRGMEILVALAALVLPGGLLLLYVYWRIRRAQERQRESLVAPHGLLPSSRAVPINVPDASSRVNPA